MQKGGKKLGELCSVVFLKVKLVRDKIEYLAEEISQQSIEHATWLFLTICMILKMQRKKNEFKSC